MESIQVNLELRTRPINLAFLVSDVEDIQAAIHFFTHIPGGGVNFIFPLSTNAEETIILIGTLKQANLDYILVPDNAVNEEIDRIFEEVTALPISVSHEDIQSHITGEDFLRVNRGHLPHILPILDALYPNRLETSLIYMLPPQVRTSLPLMLQFGIPSDETRRYLRQHMAAKELCMPQTIGDLIKVSCIAAKWTTPISLTRTKTRVASDLMNADVNILSLYLYEDDLHIATSFWNMRRGLRGNKLCLPKTGFLQELDVCIELLLDVFPSIHTLALIFSSTQEQAQEIYTNVAEEINRHRQNVGVFVTYNGFQYQFDHSSFSIGRPYKATHSVNPDKSVRFSLLIPEGYTQARSVFGYDAEVTFESGKYLDLPDTQTSTLLLSNELERIELAERDEGRGGRFLLRSEITRPIYKGVAGTANSAEETRFYLHEDETIIIRHLRDINLELKSNKYTRYAQGFVRRFGGMRKTLDFVRIGGANIIAALMSHRAEQAGFNVPQINSFLQSQCHIQQPQNVTNEHLPSLLAAEFVRRGSDLTCPSCDLRDWYPLDAIHEMIECKGCAQLFQLPLKNLQFMYKANELAARFVETGGQAVLMTAEVCSSLWPSSVMHFGGDLRRRGERETFAEVDLLWFTQGALAIAECKSYNHIDDAELQDIENALENAIHDIAIPIDARIIFLGISTNQTHPQLHDIVSRAASQARERGIGLHLILNRNIHLAGQQTATPIREVHRHDLSVQRHLPIRVESLGQRSRHFGLGSVWDGLDEATINRWLQEQLQPEE